MTVDDQILAKLTIIEGQLNALNNKQWYLMMVLVSALVGIKLVG